MPQIVQVAPKMCSLTSVVPFHRTHPAADAKFAFQSRFVELDRFQGFRIFVADRRNVRREAIDGDYAFW